MGSPALSLCHCLRCTLFHLSTTSPYNTAVSSRTSISHGFQMFLTSSTTPSSSKMLSSCKNGLKNILGRDEINDLKSGRKVNGQPQTCTNHETQRSFIYRLNRISCVRIAHTKFHLWRQTRWKYRTRREVNGSRTFFIIEPKPSPYHHLFSIA